MDPALNLTDRKEPAPVGSVTTPTSGVPEAAVRYERGSRTLKHGDTFAVFDEHGDAVSWPGNPEGIFHRDTRHLSHLSLTINGLHPLLLSSTLGDDNATLNCDLTNPDIIIEPGGDTVCHDLLHIRKTRFLLNGVCYERLLLRNFDDRERTVHLDIAFAADFADLFEIRGQQRARRGQLAEPEVESDRVSLSYLGLDGRTRATILRFDPEPETIAGDRARYHVTLAPREFRSFFIEIICDKRSEERTPPRKAYFSALRRAHRALRHASARAASIETSNDIFNEAARRSIADLYMLMTDTPEGPYPYAGIPWFSTVFGRDALITALETLWLDPAIACGVLKHLAANQAVDINPEADAEPGKILHEMRYGEMAELSEIPFRRYYGSIDSTPLFVMLAGAYLQRTGDIETLRGLWPHISAALDWITCFGDRDGDGFVEYGARTDKGLANQGWKDSHDSVFHKDGRLAKGPIALIEVQAYVYGAWRAAAAIARQLDKDDEASNFDHMAETLRIQFDKAFFDEELQTYILALDGEKKPCRVRSSNAGHALFTGIAFPERAGAVVDTLMAQSSFCGWGVRTIAASEARYNPMSYHNGSVWPHDNALIAAGFVRYGYRAEAARIFEALFATSTYIDLRRLPELYCGFVRQRGKGPTFYPVSCIPQAWAAAAPLFLLATVIGLGFNPRSGQLSLNQPVLPSITDEVVLRNLRLGSASADIALRGTQSKVVVDVLERTGEIKVVTTN